MQVPYKPFPTVEPTSKGTPSIGLSVPGAAFGTNIAQAEEGLGRELQHVGDEFARRAIQFQELDNQTWAKDTDVKVMAQIGQAQNDFNQQEGNNSTAALAAHQQRIQAIRQEALDSAPNMMARKLLDESVARRVGFALVDAGGRAGQQAKLASRRAEAASVDMEQSQFDPRSAGSKNSLDNIRRVVRERGMDEGDNEITIANNIRKETSKAWLSSLPKVAAENPDQANQIFQGIKDELDPPVRDTLQNVINGAMVNKDTHLEAAKILSKYDASLGPGHRQEILDKAEEVAEKKGKNNPLYRDALINRVRGMISIAEGTFHDNQRNWRNQVQGFVDGNPTDPNSRIVDMDSVMGATAPEKIRNTYNALDDQGKRAVEAQVLKNSKKDVPFDEKRQKRYDELWGMSTRDPANFGNISIRSEDLPHKQIESLVKRQRQILDKALPDSAINKYMKWAEPVFHDAGIRPGKPESDESKQYDEFLGGLDQQVSQWKEDHGKPPEPKDVREIARGMLEKVVTQPGGTKDRWLPWDIKERRFEVKIDPADYKIIEDAYIRTQGTKPTPEMVRKKYMDIKKFPTPGGQSLKPPPDVKSVPSDVLEDF